MTPERFQRLREILDRRQPDLTVLMEHVHKGHNFAAVLRSCDAVGCLEAHAVLLHGRMPSRRRMSSAGSLRWMQLRPHVDIVAGARALHDRGFQILAAHLSERARDFRDIDNL